MSNELKLSSDSTLKVGNKPSGKLMFQFEDDEPTEAATIFDYAEVSIKMRQNIPIEGASIGICSETTSIEFTSNDGKKFKLFIQDL